MSPGKCRFIPWGTHGDLLLSAWIHSTAAGLLPPHEAPLRHRGICRAHGVTHSLSKEEKGHSAEAAQLPPLSCPLHFRPDPSHPGLEQRPAQHRAPLEIRVRRALATLRQGRQCSTTQPGHSAPPRPDPVLQSWKSPSNALGKDSWGGEQHSSCSGVAALALSMPLAPELSIGGLS